MPLCLVVDDDPMSCKMAADIAGSTGLQVRMEQNGIAALSFCKSQMPDVIILDVLMPRMDGIEFLRELHRMIGGRRPYVIACTAVSDMNTIQSLQKEEINSYIVKPYTRDTLIAKIKASKIV